MNKHEGSGAGQSGGGPKQPQEEPRQSRTDHARALAISAALVVLFFVVHVLVLVLVDPLKILPLSKLNAYAASIIPLGMGLVFCYDAIVNFLRIEKRSAVQFAWFLVAILFGSFSIHGLLGFILFVIRHPPAF
jgi:carbon starvation protein CstA